MSIEPKHYPWQGKILQRVQTMIADKRLPHALLLEAEAGFGQVNFSAYLAKTLLCEKQSVEPCNTCKACHLCELRTHPDLLILRPEETGKAIKVDAIRALTESFTQSGQLSNRRVVILTPAEALNRAAANALLKTLEEPCDGLSWLLVTSHASTLSQTVKSRCQTLSFTPEPVESAKWLSEELSLSEADSMPLLQSQEFAPIRARDFYQSEAASAVVLQLTAWNDFCSKRLTVTALAERWSKGPLSAQLELLLAWVTDMTLIKAGAGAGQIVNSGQYATLKTIATSSKLDGLFGFESRLNHLFAATTQGLQMNAQLLFEELLLLWNKTVRI